MRFFKMADTFMLEDLECRFAPLTIKEGITISENLMSCMPLKIGNDSKENSSEVDLGKFSKLSIKLILSKLQVKNNDKFENVGDETGLSLYFQNPLISMNIVMQFMEYITPFFQTLKKSNTMARLQK